MAAIIGEIENDLDVIQFFNHNEDESSMEEMIRTTSGLFATLDKLTNEIVEEDLTSVEGGGTPSSTGSQSQTGSNESPTQNDDDDDDDYYSDDEDRAYSDEEDPDSGETKLSAMMDELVAELQIQLEEDSDDEEDDDGDDENENNTSAVDGGNNSEGGVSNVNKNTEHTSMAETLTVEDDQNNKEDGLRAEKQRHAELHQHVQTLLEQVVEMKMLFILDKTTSSSARNKNDEKIGANIQKKILEDGDYYADRLEHLMGAISDYANKDAVLNMKPRHYVKIKKKKRKQRTNKHKKRKPRASVQTTRSLHILHDSLLALEEKLAREEQSWQ